MEKWFSEPEGKSRWKHCFERSLDLQWDSSQLEASMETNTVYKANLLNQRANRGGYRESVKADAKTVLFSLWVYVYTYAHAHIGQLSIVGAIPQAICLDFCDMVSYWLT